MSNLCGSIIKVEAYFLLRRTQRVVYSPDIFELGQAIVNLQRIHMTKVTLNDLVNAALTGKLISFPTDTVPALATKPEFSELIFQAKQRTQDKPLILMTARIEDIWDYVTGSAAELQIWQKMANKYLPGAVTLVLPSSSLVPPIMNPKEPNTIGVRVPNLAIAQQILAQTGPLATTSANLSGQPPLMTMAQISVQFPQVLTLSEQNDLMDLKTVGTPSTVIKWDDGNWRILRQGGVRIGEIESEN